MELEQAYFLKVPNENLSKTFRATKRATDKELDALSEKLSKLESSNFLSKQIFLQSLTILIEKLENFKSKMNSLYDDEHVAIKKCFTRIQHLQQHPAAIHRNKYFHSLTFPSSSFNSVPKESSNNKDTDSQSTQKPSKTITLFDTNAKHSGLYSNQTVSSGKNVSLDSESFAMRWAKSRLDRILADYMLREGYYKSAKVLMNLADIRDYIDLEVFTASKKVIDAFHREDCSEALKWCSDNKKKLSKLDSQLEFKLRVQEFVELLKKCKTNEAIAYAKNHIAPNASPPQNFKMAQRALTLLAFPPGTVCEPYQSLYHADRWNDLIRIFKRENYQLNGLTSQSLMEISLKSGLASLKTQFCADESHKNVNCPTCIEPFRSLAENLPYSHHIHSILVCSISGAVMNEHNPPMVLPNGNVYSQEALELMSVKNDGKITDPRTKETFEYSDPKIRKAFIM